MEKSNKWLYLSLLLGGGVLVAGGRILDYFSGIGDLSEQQQLRGMTRLASSLSGTFNAGSRGSNLDLMDLANMTQNTNEVVETTRHLGNLALTTIHSVLNTIDRIPFNSWEFVAVAVPILILVVTTMGVPKE